MPECASSFRIFLITCVAACLSACDTSTGLDGSVSFSGVVGGPNTEPLPPYVQIRDICLVRNQDGHQYPFGGLRQTFTGAAPTDSAILSRFPAVCKDTGTAGNAVHLVHKKTTITMPPTATLPINAATWGTNTA